MFIIFATVMQTVGVVLFLWGMWLVYIPLAAMGAGVILFILGVLLERMTLVRVEQD